MFYIIMATGKEIQGRPITNLEPPEEELPLPEMVFCVKEEPVGELQLEEDGLTVDPLAMDPLAMDPLALDVDVKLPLKLKETKQELKFSPGVEESRGSGIKRKMEPDAENQRDQEGFLSADRRCATVACENRVCPCLPTENMPSASLASVQNNHRVEKKEEVKGKQSWSTSKEQMRLAVGYGLRELKVVVRRIYEVKEQCCREEGDKITRKEETEQTGHCQESSQDALQEAAKGDCEKIVSVKNSNGMMQKVAGESLSMAEKKEALGTCAHHSAKTVEMSKEVGNKDGNLGAAEEQKRVEHYQASVVDSVIGSRSKMTQTLSSENDKGSPPSPRPSSSPPPPPPPSSPPPSPSVPPTPPPSSSSPPPPSSASASAPPPSSPRLKPPRPPLSPWGLDAALRAYRKEVRQIHQERILASLPPTSARDPDCLRRYKEYLKNSTDRRRLQLCWNKEM